MAYSALSNKQGYTLIELLIALSILAVVSVALMQSTLVVIQTNSQNEMRDEAVRIGEQKMNEIRSNPGGFDAIAVGVASSALSRVIRNATVNYTVGQVIAALDTNNKQITVNVNWTFRNRPYSHSIMSIVRR